MIKIQLVIAGIFLMICTDVAYGATYTVGHDMNYDYQSITDALDAGIVVAGDILLVADGTYNATDPNYPETFPLVMKEGVTLKREWSGIVPVIDAEDTARVFYCDNIGAGPSETRIEGFKITGGMCNVYSSSGGGLHLIDTILTLADCTIVGNSSNYHGGGIGLDYSSPNLINCTINGNSAIFDCAGLYCDHYSSPILTNCTITGNSASGNGGGLHCDYRSSPILTNCTITGNSAKTGGGLYCRFLSSPTLRTCTITGNASSFAYGGGIFCDRSSPTLSNCTITFNSAHSDGGGLYCRNRSSPIFINGTIAYNSAENFGGGLCFILSSPMLINCTIIGNSANSDGGGLRCYNSSPILTNCTFTGNSTDTFGGGLYCEGHLTLPILTNCILWNDTPNEIHVHSGAPEVTYCDVQQGYAGEGNIDCDPFLSIDWHLTACSCCIDAGTNTGAPLDDFDGQTRPNPDTNIVDIGADEYYGITQTPTEIPCINNGDVTLDGEITTGDSLLIQGISVGVWVMP